eukprot:2457657-Pyramimonas_sp.AAC.1
MAIDIGKEGRARGTQQDKRELAIAVPGLQDSETYCMQASGTYCLGWDNRANKSGSPQHPFR